MVQFLLKNYRNLICLALLLLSILLHAFAAPTPTCPIVTERFQGLTDGTISNNSSTGWTIDASNVISSGYFAVKSNRFTAREIGGEGRWYSKVFSVAGYSDFQVAVKITAEGDMNSSEYVKVYYKVNGGAETLLDSRTGNFGTIDFISPTLTGNNVQIIVKLYNYNNGGSQTSKYYIEEYRVFKEHGPCGSSIPVSITAGNGGVLTCLNPSLTVSASTSASGTTTWSWSGPNGFSSNSQNPSVNVGGTYTVVGTNAAGSGSATVTVSENKAAPVITATGGNLGCAPGIVINATSSVSNSTFSWTGPGGFNSQLQNPTVNAAGSYTVTVTNPANGCTAFQSVTVTSTSNSPTTLWSENFTLANNTSASGVWSSTTPAGTFSVQSNEFRINNIGTAGEAVWTSGSIAITGKSNVNISAGVRSGVSSGGTLENSGSSLDYVRFYYKLNNGSEILFSEYLGAINNNSSTNTTVSVGSLGGASLEIVIRARATASDEFYYFDNISVTGVNSSATITPSVSGPVTCTGSAQLSASVSGGTVSSWAWTGPNGFTSSLQNPTVMVGGQYIVTANLSSGGCSVTAPITVNENKTIVGIASAPGILTCNNPSVTLTGSSTATGALYSWSGPDGFSSTLQNPVVNKAGLYTLTVTANGCSGTDTALVNQNIAVPQNITTSSTTGSNQLTCLVGGLTLNGSSTTAGVTYSWTLPNGVTGAGSATSATLEGTYIFTVTNSGNGCSATDTFNVVRNMATPQDASISGGNQFLTCIKSSVTLTASNNLAGVTFNWIGPDGYTSSGPVATVSQPGFYNVIMTHPVTGCNHSIGAAVLMDTAKPANVMATPTTNGGQLTCTYTSITLAGSSSTSGVSYEWSAPGFSAATQNTSVNTAGAYTLTVTNASNGCSNSAIAIVTQNKELPAGVTATFSDVLTCFTTEVDLTGTSTTPGVNYLWTGPSGFNSTTNRITQTEIAGAYQLRVTNPANGCFRIVSTTVEEDKAPPANISANNAGPITCSTTSVSLLGSTSASDVDYMWTGPNNFVSFLQNPTISVPGEYVLTVTDLVTNGCSGQATTTVAFIQCSGGDSHARTITNVLRPAAAGPSEQDPASSKFEYKTYPNPFNEKAIIEFRSPVNDFIRIELYNSHGGFLKPLFHDHVVAGRSYTVQADGNNLPQGVYYYMIRAGNKRIFSGKLLLIRR